jgi:hypothetical protein
MSKNPFVNCKSHKQRKIRDPIVKPKEKLFCPHTMVKFGNEQFEIKSMGIYKMLLKSLFGEVTDYKDLTICNTLSRSDEANPPTKK